MAMKEKLDGLSDEEVKEMISSYMRGEFTVPGKKSAKTMVNGALSLLTKYVSVGYNYIRGSPDGNFSTGGADPGIRIDNNIFDLTYNQQKSVLYNGVAVSVPDQVDFLVNNSCSNVEYSNFISGARSYQDELSTAVVTRGIYNNNI